MKKVLVVDDDSDIVDFVLQVLTKQKYEVYSASDGKAGYERARQVKPDLVILDLMMPDMHGFEVCSALRKDESLKGVKIIVSSGKRYEADKRASQRLGADMFLTKPYSIAQLLEGVTTLIGEP